MKYKINKDLLPMKGHFFFFNAGTAPLVPYLSTYARQLGFSSIVVGIIYTFLPISGLIAKPLFGAIADKFQKHKSLFIAFQIVTILFFSAIYFIPESQNDLHVDLSCGNGATFASSCFNYTKQNECKASQFLKLNNLASCEMSCELDNTMQWRTVCEHWRIPKYCYNLNKTIKFTSKISSSNSEIDSSCIHLYTDEVIFSDGRSYKPMCHVNTYFNTTCSLSCSDGLVGNISKNTEFDFKCREKTHFSTCNVSPEHISLFKDGIGQKNDTTLCKTECKATEMIEWTDICNGWKADLAPECQPQSSALPKRLNFNGKFPLSFTDRELNCLYYKLYTVILDDESMPYYPTCPPVANTSSNHFHSRCNIKCDEPAMNEMLRSSTNDSTFDLNSKFWLFFLFMIGSWIGMAVVVSIADSICFEMLGSKPSKYGKQRLWGSVGWGVFSLATGVLIDQLSDESETKDYTIAFVFMFIFMAFDVIVSFKLKYKVTKMSVNLLRDIGTLFSSWHIVIFFLWTISVGLCTGLLWQFLFWHLEDIAYEQNCGATDWIKTLQGLVSAVQTFGGEIPFMLISGPVLKKIGHIHSMSLVLLAFGIRFILYSFLTNAWWVLPIEMFQGVTYGMFYPTMASYASVVALPGTEATVQGIVGAVFEGVGTSLGSLIGGTLFDKYRGDGTFRIFGIGALLLCLLHVIIQYFLPNRATKNDSQQEFHSIVHYTTPADAIQILEEEE